MSIFQDVVLEWHGDKYTIPSNDVMRLIAKVEEEISIPELLRPAPPFAKLAMAYAVALTHAGAKVTAEEVYASLFEEESARAAASASIGLQMLMFPPENYSPHGSAESSKKKQEANQEG